ncbi:hypothetical protein HK097_003671 [Rhizophlyctis rosea]|uniref:Uncharacterized protein n=1 Tax=Rhizophlyctis rosea TaxID=64517 RepID=A0AAD5S297_9FUNG|nr:hypothetical protein HK097_003671 [Rhizophlyctis rosea]
MAVREKARKRLIASAGVFALAAAIVGTAAYWWAVRERKRRGNGEGRGGNSRPTVESGEESSRGEILLEKLLGQLRTSKRKEKVPITISMKNIILWNPSPDPQTPNHAFIESTLPFLFSLVSSPHYQVHLIMVVSSDKEQQHIERILHSSKLYSNGLDKGRVLFCETEEGKAHIVRSISSVIHVDNNDEVVRLVSPHVGVVLRVRRKLRMVGDEKGRRASAGSSKVLKSGAASMVSTAPSSASSSGMTIINRPATPDAPAIRISTAPPQPHTSTTPPSSSNIPPAPSLLRSETQTSLSSVTTATSRRGSFSGTAGLVTPVASGAGAESGSESEADDLVKLGNVKFVPSLIESGLLDVEERGRKVRR